MLIRMESRPPFRLVLKDQLMPSPELPSVENEFKDVKSRYMIFKNTKEVVPSKKKILKERTVWKPFCGYY